MQSYDYATKLNSADGLACGIWELKQHPIILHQGLPTFLRLESVTF